MTPGDIDVYDHSASTFQHLRLTMSLCMSQFLTVVSRDIKNYDNESDLKGAWKVFDREGKGYISAAELKHVLGNIGEALSPTELDDLIKEADPNNAGKITYDEVREVLQWCGELWLHASVLLGPSARGK